MDQQKDMTSDRSLLTDKELHYLKDYLSWELLAMKKCGHAANHCTDAAIAGVINDIGKKHRQHYETLLAHLQQGGSI